jgi:hypothetical protein
MPGDAASRLKSSVVRMRAELVSTGQRLAVLIRRRLDVLRRQ